MKKGFTLVELLGVIILIGVLALVTISISQSIVEENRLKVYKSHEEAMVRGARAYFLAKDIILPSEEGRSVTVNLSSLQEYGFVGDIKDSRGSVEYCSGHVTVTRIGKPVFVAHLDCGESYTTDS